MIWVSVAMAAGALAGLTAYAVRGRSATLLAPSVHRGPRHSPNIALTFDDGPSEATPAVLDLLERHGAKGTFFQCGLHVRRLPAIACEVAARGHEIGNHTDTHARLYLRGASFICRELTRAQETIRHTCGVTPTLFRATYGARWFGLRRAQRQLGLTGVMWTVNALDWKLPPDGISDRLMRGAGNGAIFCLHDGREATSNPDINSTLKALEQTLPALARLGFRCVTVSELLGFELEPRR